jgi:hypothetical protein
MPRGLKKLTHAASTEAAWRDWQTLQSWCDQNGKAEWAAIRAPKANAGHKTIDRQIERLRVALGAPEGAWENVVDGLAPAQREQQQQGDDPTYSQRVYQAYQALVAETQSPDVAINALHRRVGGSIHELHSFLRQECHAQRCAVSTGEPAFAGQAALQSALTLPGEIDRATGKPQSFLLIKLIQPPPMTQEQPRQPTAALAPSLGGRLTRDDLDVILEALEYRCDAISGGTDFDEVTRLKSIGATLEKLRALEAQPQRTEHERYQSLLRAMAALRYPAEERTPELEARIEKTIARKVQEFREERALKVYEASLRREVAQRHPNLTPAEAKRYEQRIAELVAEFRQKQRQPQQEQQQQTRIQQQGRGIEQSL